MVCVPLRNQLLVDKKKEKETSEEENIGKVSDNNKNKIAAYRFLKDKNEREIWINKILYTK